MNKFPGSLVLFFAPVLATPVAAQAVEFSPPAASYPMPMQVSLAPNGPGRIYYTTDGSPPQAVFFDSFTESANRKIGAHAADEGRTSSVWRIHPESYVDGRTNNDISVVASTDAARGDQYNARAFVIVSSYDVTVTAVVNARGGSTEFGLQARLDPAANTYYGLRVKPSRDVLEVTRTRNGVTAPNLANVPVKLANSGTERISYSVSGQNPVELAVFRNGARLFRMVDGSADRIASGSAVAMRFRQSPTNLPPTGEITSFQVVEAAETVNKPTRRYSPQGVPIKLTDTALIQAYLRNGIDSSAVNQARYTNQETFAPP